MLDFKTMSKEDLQVMEDIRTEKMRQKGNEIAERKSQNPVINELRFNYGYIYLGNFLFGDAGRFELKEYQDEKRIHLAYIEVYEEERKQGIGTRMLRTLTHASDIHQFVIDLEIRATFGVSYEILERFYKNAGFQRKENTGAIYVRFPKMEE